MRESERAAFEGIVDLLRTHEKLSLALIVRTEIPDDNVDPKSHRLVSGKLVEKWKAELVKKIGVKESRIFILNGGGTSDKPLLEVWVVPPGASLPDPNAREEQNAP